MHHDGEIPEHMRVIAGRYRSRQLVAPRGIKTRPTSDRMRETLFNVLAPRIQDAVVADLFAGTGAIGIEALSRGARQVYFAENARPALMALRANLQTLGIGPEATVEASGALPLLRRLVASGVRLDVIYLDPPYREEQAYTQILGFLGREPILQPDAVVVAEHTRRTELPEVPGLEAYREITHGEASICFFRRNPLEQAEPANLA
jgi:16S rRNA (guanine966-N2)-methyltransferase